MSHPTNHPEGGPPLRSYSHRASVHRGLKLDHHGDYQRGADVLALQRAVNKRLRARGLDRYCVKVDGEYGPHTAAACAKAIYALGALWPLCRRAAASHGGRLGRGMQTLIRKPGTRGRGKLHLARVRRERHDREVGLRERALAEARHLIGVMEHGGNNRGAEVERIIHENGGVTGEPWCGDFVAHCYRVAGSKAVQRLWASVWWLGRLTGLVTVSDPKPGDIVRYTFSHTGIFERDNGDGTITTIEGNTGRVGAVSDSSTGGDGVYRKVRPKSLVANYRHATR